MFHTFHQGSPTTSLYTPWSKEEAKAYLTAGWGEGAITEFNLEYLYGPEPEVSGEPLQSSHTAP